VTTNQPVESVVKRKRTIAERAVRGVLGGWVYGKTRVVLTQRLEDGGAYACVRVDVPAAAVAEMLKREREQKSPAVRGKKKGASR